MVKALRESGIEPEPLMLQAGLNPASFSKPEQRLPQEASTRFWQLAAETIDDESLGLWVSRYSSHTTFHALGYAFMASRSLADAMRRMVRYDKMISDVVKVQLQERGERSELSWIIARDAPQPAAEAVEAAIAATLRACRRLAGKQFTPLSVRLMRPTPREEQPFRQFFRCDVHFNARRYDLEFDTQQLEQPLADANEMLAQSNDRLVEQYLAQTELGTLATRLRSMLEKELPSGVCSAEKYASIMGMSGRSLQRKLSAEGTSFNQVLNDTRCELAKFYLSNPHHQSLTDIAFLLGFSDTSSFSRAFHRWMDMSPSAYRAQNKF